MPQEHQANVYTASVSYSTTENGKRVRVRYILIARLSEETQQRVMEKLEGFSSKFKAALALQDSEIRAFAQYFREAIVTSSEMFDK